jgi:hypothetical protein
MVKKNSIIYQCYVNLLARHPHCHHHCSCHRCHCPLCRPPPSLLPPSSFLSPSPSPSPFLACHPHCHHHRPLHCCCSPLTRNPCRHRHCLVGLTLFVTRHPHCRSHRPFSPCPFPLCHPPASSPSPLLLPSPLPATLNAVAIALATVAIALFVARHPHHRGHCPLCRQCRCSPATVVAIAIALFASAAIHGDCHCAVAAVLPSIAPPPLTAIRIVPPLLLSPTVTPAVAHCCHHRPSPPPLPVAIALPSRRPLHIRRRCPLQLCCYHARRPSTCRLVVMLDWLSLGHLHANGVMVSHVGGKRVTNKEVEIWDQSLTKDRWVKHRPTKNVGEQVTNKEVEIWDQSPTKDRWVTFEPKSQLPSPRAPINMIGGRAWSPGLYRAQRLQSKSLNVAWERAFIRPLTL